jgi:hypothetical protein
LSKYSDMIDGPKTETKLDGPKNNFEDDIQKYGSSDPRLDKAVDHRYWEDLLWNAWQLDNTSSSLYYLLHGIRCGGGELTMTRGSFRLLPGDWTEEEWAKIRKENLDPVKERLVRVLKVTREGRVEPIEIPEEWINGKDVPEDVPPVKEEQGRLFG